MGGADVGASTKAKGGRGEEKSERVVKKSGGLQRCQDRDDEIRIERFRGMQETNR